MKRWCEFNKKDNIMLKNSKGEPYNPEVRDIDVDENGVNDFEEYGCPYNEWEGREVSSAQRSSNSGLVDDNFKWRIL